MTREQIKALAARPEPSAAPPAPGAGFPAAGAGHETPVLPPGIEQYYLPASGAGQGVVYRPAVVGQAEIHYSSPRYNLAADETVGLAAEFSDGPVPVDWDQAAELRFDPAGLGTVPVAGADFAALPDAGKDPAAYRKWGRDLQTWLRQNRPVTLYRARAAGALSEPGESEATFRSRLAQKARERRDTEVEKIRRKYTPRFDTLKGRLMRAEQAVEREAADVKSRKLETAISFGSALLGAFLGRKAVSATSTYRVGTAVRSASRIGKEKMDVERARETAQAVRLQMEELEARLQEDIAAVEASHDPLALDLERVTVNPKSSDIVLKLFGLGWLPFRRDAAGRLSPDWK